MHCVTRIDELFFKISAPSAYLCHSSTTHGHFLTQNNCFAELARKFSSVMSYTLNHKYFSCNIDKSVDVDLGNIWVASALVLHSFTATYQVACRSTSFLRHFWIIIDHCRQEKLRIICFPLWQLFSFCLHLAIPFLCYLKTTFYFYMIHLFMLLSVTYALNCVNNCCCCFADQNKFVYWNKWWSSLNLWLLKAFKRKQR